MLIAETKIKHDSKGIPIVISGHDIPNRGNWRVFKPVIDLKTCIKCKLCWLYCPDIAISLTKKEYPKVDSYTCKGCGTCVAVCPVKCIKMERDFHRGK